MVKLDSRIAAAAVPDWRRRIGSALGSVPTLGLALAFLACQIWLLPTLTDWGTAAADEGLLSYAALRMRGGNWPYRDFFYPHAPGAPALHALLQGAGLGWGGERAASLAASFGSLWLTLSFARAWRIPLLERVLLAGLLVAWSFSLWNIPQASWYAVFFTLLAIRALPRSLVVGAALFALAFWFQPNMGILGACGAGAFQWYTGERQRLIRFMALVFAGLMFPFLAIALFGGAFALTQSLRQIFLLPLGPSLASEAFAAPLTSLGLWMLSLFFLRADHDSRSGRLVQIGVVAYAGIYAARDFDVFIRSFFILLSLFTWPLALALALTEKSRDLRFLAWWFPALGIFLSVFPRLDFQHFLVVFPLTALVLAHALGLVQARYHWLPPLWARLPAIALLAGGIYLQTGVAHVRLDGARDSLERVSLGSGQRLDEEVTAVWRFLKGEGLKPGDPLLVLPNAPALYLWTGFRNPTPYLQFAPGYVEAFGEEQRKVLPRFRAAGGRFLVVQERSDIDAAVPEIWRQIQTDYREVKSFPEHFTIYAPR